VHLTELGGVFVSFLVFAVRQTLTIIDPQRWIVK